MISNLLILGSKSFNNSLNEVKEYLNFSLIFFDFSKKNFLIDMPISAVILESQILDTSIANILNKINDKTIV